MWVVCSSILSDQGLTLKTSALKLFTAANLHYQLSRSFSQSVSQLVTSSFSQLISKSVNQWSVNLLIRLLISQLSSESVRLSDSQSVHWNISNSFRSLFSQSKMSHINLRQ